jgi:hypothetical protein
MTMHGCGVASMELAAVDCEFLICASETATALQIFLFFPKGA